MKDPEKFGGAESSVEGLDDMMVQAGNNLVQLNLLLKFFEEMYEIAKPYADQKNGKINVPGKKIPIDRLSPQLKASIDAIDSAFVETMRYSEWIQVFIEGYKRIKKKIEQQKTNIYNELK